MTYYRSCLVALMSALGVCACNGVSYASAIYGTLSNFDIYNTTPEPAEGAEIELEGCDSSSIGGHFPSHFSAISVTNYNENGKTGARIRFEGYNFNLPVTLGSLQPNPNPVSTNGHQLTNSAGGEHFGFWLNGAQPTETRFFWLNNNNGAYQRIGNLPAIVPGPTWSYVPPANPGDPPVVQAVVKVPEPAEVILQKPDSTWMKVYKVKLPASAAPDDPVEMQALLVRLISDANPENQQPDVPFDDIVPEGDDPAEVESEWELLEGGKAPKEKMNEDPIDEMNDKLIIRRYEFYEYTGAYDAEHEPITAFLDPGDLLEPPVGELGNFISANMVGAVLNPIQAVVPGDFDSDGDVDGADFVAWQTNFPTASGATLAQGDADGDGDVDGADFVVWQTSFPFSPAAGNSLVPEPPAALLISFGAVAFAAFRWRHLKSAK